MESFPKFYNRARDGQKPELTAILSKDKMFLLKYSAHQGDGFEFRIYKTRKMVLKYSGSGKEIKFDEFKLLLSTVFAEYLLEIDSYIPRAMIEASSSRQLTTTKTSL